MTKITSANPANSGATIDTEARESLTPDATEMADSFEAKLDAKHGSLDELAPSASWDPRMTSSGPLEHGLPTPARHLSVKQRVTVERHVAEGKEIVKEKEDQAKNEADYKLAQADSQYDPRYAPDWYIEDQEPSCDV